MYLFSIFIIQSFLKVVVEVSRGTLFKNWFFFSYIYSKNLIAFLNEKRQCKVTCVQGSAPFPKFLIYTVLTRLIIGTLNTHR